MLLDGLWVTKRFHSVFKIGFSFSLVPRVTWLVEDPGGRAVAHKVSLARLSQASVAAGLGTSVGGHLWLPAQLFGGGPAKTPSVG